MAKSINRKLKLFYLREILLENTDEGHYLTMNEIIGALENVGIKAERKSIYNDIDLLRELGLKIINHKRLGYAVVKRKFDMAEIELIIEALDNMDIMDAKRQAIKEKLISLLSKYEIRKLLE